MQEEELRALLRGFSKSIEEQILRPPWQPQPHQIPPPGDWYGWLMLGGRGSGKTDAMAKYVTEHVKGPACMSGNSPHWISIIAPTLGDAVTSCFAGPSGIRAHDPSAKLLPSAPGGITIRWPNGSEAKLFGASNPEDVERLRSGGNRCLSWLEEVAAWRYLEDVWAQMRFGLRIGRRPHWVGSTTPKPRPLIKRLDKGEIANVVKTHATMFDNPFLPEHIKQALLDTYQGTALGDQELHGRIIEQDENALWTREMISDGRVKEHPPLRRISVGVDPSGGRGEQGIVVVGKAMRDEITNGVKRSLPVGYTLADATCRLSPAGWGKRAVDTAVEWQADDICVETNFGGDMALDTIRTAATTLGVSIPIRMVHASRGKRVRAEPVAALYSQGRWHHVGVFEALEDQQCLTEDTPVTTARGDVPISEVRSDDLVRTRAGWAPLAWSGMTGMVHDLVGIHVRDCVLWCTPWHPIYLPNQDQFVPAKSVRRGQRLAVEPSLGSMVIPSRGAGVGGIWSRTAITDTPEVNCSIELSGRRTEAPSRQDITFTIETGTGRTTRSGISTPAHRASMSRPTVVHTERSLNRQMSEVRNVKLSGRFEFSETGSVSSVVNCSNRVPRSFDTAVVDAVVERSISAPVPVFNLMVADGHLPEFFARGVLVHNCTWYPELDWSPDRLDANVWPGHHMKIVSASFTGNASFGGSLMASRSLSP